MSVLSSAPHTPHYRLRPDQERTLQAIKQALAQESSVLATAPTGFGKTVCFSEIIRRSGLRGVPVDIVVHREELIAQSAAKIREQTGMEPGIVWQRRREWNRPVRVISHGALASLSRLPPGVRGAPLLILDEAHHGSAPGWRRAMTLLAPRWLVGFTATPFRHDREPLSPDPFRQVIRTTTPQELIDLGILVPPVVESPVIADALGQPQPINRAANLPALYTQAVRYALAQGRSKIILFTSGAGSRSPGAVGDATREELARHGIPAGNISQNLPSPERRRITDSFDAMSAAVLISYMTLTEGFDSTAVDCVILGRQTRSEATLIQMIGRGLRSHPGKESCLVLDFTGRDDVYDVINYWRLDEPAPGRRRRREPTARVATERQLDALTATFPRLVSSLDQARARFPWFQPFPQRRLQALDLWNPEQTGQGSTYVCVEVTARHRWTVYRVNLPIRGSRVQAGRVARAGLDSAAAAQAVADLVGDRSRLISRSARWRQQPASARQRQLWQALNGSAPPEGLTRGDASDAISRQRFLDHVTLGLF